MKTLNRNSEESQLMSDLIQVFEIFISAFKAEKNLKLIKEETNILFIHD